MSHRRAGDLVTKVVVIGAGAVGLACAYYMRREGVDVTVVDKGEPGAACSAGNMGWITPSLSHPLPAPGVVRQTLTGVLKPGNPLYVTPSAMARQARWFYDFWRNCTPRKYERALRANLELSNLTLGLFDELEKHEDISFEHYKNGLLYVADNEADLDKKHAYLAASSAPSGVEPTRLSRDELLRMEPDLSDKLAGALYMANERHVRPESLTGALWEWLDANGAEVRANTEVTDLRMAGTRVTKVEVESGEPIEGDHVVIAGGVWSNRLTKKIGYTFPLTAGKGYSTTITEPEVKLNHPLYFGTAGMSPFEQSLRFGGTMEMSGINDRLNPSRVEAIRRSISAYFNVPLRGSSEIVWCGMRPMTSDGVPVVGNVPGTANAFLATGHVMSGISMALSTGHVLSELVLEGKEVIDLEPLSPERFVR